MSNILLTGLLSIGFSVSAIYIVWIFYLAVMNLKRARDNKTLTKTALVLGYPILLIGYAADILLNISVCSVLFLELPKEFTVTARVQRHLYTGSGWRENLAGWFCHNLLNAFDPDGKHC
jgi:hypothetical protein